MVLQVPRQQWDNTPVVLLATAGLRMLGPAKTLALLQACRRELRRSVFMFRDHWVAVLSGRAEGVYGWFAVNYATGALQLVGSTIPFLVVAASCHRLPVLSSVAPQMHFLHCFLMHCSGHA
jgi:Golgi nucleoside diphosphatase